MKMIEAVIRSEKMNQVKSALSAIGVQGMTVNEVRGQGEQKGLEFINRAGKYRVDLLPKTMIKLVVPDKLVDSIVSSIMDSARTGDIGDGKIFIIPVERCIRIRTGEEDDEAL